MSLAEISYRLRQAVSNRVERAGVGRTRQASAPTGAVGSPWVDPLPRGIDRKPYVAAADMILAGRYDVFALRDVKLGFPPRWNRDPKTGTEAPLVFGKMLDYRDERIVGNIKYLWEPNRHLELVTLAQAWHLTAEEKYARGARTLLDSWFEQCPYPLGPNWTSSLELGVRLVNWAVAWHLLDFHASPLSPRGDVGVFAGTAGGEFRQKWLDSIYRHCHFIAGHLSRHSSANNHLLGELMGLFVAGVTWPLWPESVRWRKFARRAFEEQALKQNASDGVNREQAVWYHHEVADMILLCGLLGRANGAEFADEFWRRLEAMLEFIAALRDAGGHVPALGDADDAVMVRFSREPVFDVFGSLLATGAVLFDRADFKAAAGRFEDKSRWLLGDAAAKRFAALAEVAPGAPTRRAFPDGGYWVLGCDFGTGREIRLVADAGPLGYLSIAAHGHADALALTLSAGGRELLIDPGTYAYHTDRKWRDYFRGTSAHNTVRVDGVDQAEIGGNFLWTRHARAWCMQWEPSADRDVWTSAHDGYTRLNDPVTHRRKITLNKRARNIEVVDMLECLGSHEIEIFWHLAEGCAAVIKERAVSVDSGDIGLTLEMPECDWRLQVLAGCEYPPLGWVSRRFDEKVPSSSVVWVGRISGTTKVRTLICLAMGS